MVVSIITDACDVAISNVHTDFTEPVFVKAPRTTSAVSQRGPVSLESPAHLERPGLLDHGTRSVLAQEDHAFKPTEIVAAEHARIFDAV